MYIYVNFYTKRFNVSNYSVKDKNRNDLFDTP